MTWAHMFTSIDPVVWLRMARVVFCFAAGMLMLREPMLCGGKNTTLHRALAAFFFVNSWYSYSIARLRMGSIAQEHAASIQNWSLASEIAMTAAAVLIVMKLGYDYTRWLQYHKMECHKKECSGGECTPMMVERRGNVQGLR